MVKCVLTVWSEAPNLSDIAPKWFVGSGAGQLASQSLTARYFALQTDTLCNLGVALVRRQRLKTPPIQTREPRHHGSPLTG